MGGSVNSICLILYVLRNASIISAEYIWKNRNINRRFLYSIYAIITFALVLPESHSTGTRMVSMTGTART